MIREFSTEDASEVAGLFARTPEAAHWSAREIAELHASGVRIRVDEREGEIAGAVVLRTVQEEAEILNLVVARNCREQGIGRALMQTALEYAESAGVKRVFLEVRESNSVARKFYVQMGFSENGRRKQYYNHPAEDALLLSRTVK